MAPPKIDSIIGDEGNGSHGMAQGGSAKARVLSTFLNEMDGIENIGLSLATDSVLVLAATWTLDAALLQPG